MSLTRSHLGLTSLLLLLLAAMVAAPLAGCGRPGGEPGTEDMEAGAEDHGDHDDHDHEGHDDHGHEHGDDHDDHDHGDHGDDAGEPDDGTDNGDGMTEQPVEEPVDEELQALIADARTAADEAQQALLDMYGQPNGWGADLGGRFHVGVNGLVLQAFFRAPNPILPSSDDRIMLTLQSLFRNQDEYGAIYTSGDDGGYAVYETSVCLRALTEAWRIDESLRSESWIRDAIVNGRQYLLMAQIDENPEEGFQDGDGFSISPDDPEQGMFAGGWGYGKINRADAAPANMSTTNLAAGALADAYDVDGIDATDEERARLAAARERMLNFLRANQNLTEYTDESGETQPWNQRPMTREETQDDDVLDAVDEGSQLLPSNDGGAIYGPGYSKAGYEEAQAGYVHARSYGSMTFALLRLYHIAGVTNRDDGRVAAALRWIQENYTMEFNPGMPAEDNANQQGFFYYLYSAADAFQRLVPEGELTVRGGETIDWRRDLLRTLLDRRGEDPLWRGENPRWMEADPRVATAYSMAALNQALDSLENE